MPKNMSEEINEDLMLLPQARRLFDAFGKTAEQLTVKDLGEIDLEALDKRDRPFFEKLRVVGIVDPAIIGRVYCMRTKLINGIRLTNHEAEELLEVLSCKSFHYTNLCISGH